MGSSGLVRAAVLFGVVAVSVGCDGSAALQLQHRIAMITGYTAASTNRIPGIGDVDFFLDPNDQGITKIFKNGNPWEENESHWFLRSIGEGDVVVDVGANVGYYTVLAGLRVGESGRVYAFEPDPLNFALLERNVRLNGLSDNVVLEQKAVSNEAGTIQLFLREEHSGDHRIYQPEGESRRAIDIEAVSLDQYFAGRLTGIDFLKIDTQGAEGAIVAGMKELLRVSDDLAIAIEFSPNHLRGFGSDPDELAATLSGAGFSFFDLFMGGPPRDLERRSMRWLRNFRPAEGFFTNLYLTKDPGSLPDAGRVTPP